MNIRDPHLKTGHSLDALFERHEPSVRRPGENRGTSRSSATGVDSAEQAQPSDESSPFAGLMSSIASELPSSEAVGTTPEPPEMTDEAKPEPPPMATENKRGHRGNQGAFAKVGSEALLDKIFDAVNTALSQFNVPASTAGSDMKSTVAALNAASDSSTVTETTSSSAA
jgi:hypothetical protein